MISDWIFDDNLRPFLTALGWIVGYRFDDDDWQAVHFGIRSSNSEAGLWYDYRLAGKHSVRLIMAHDPGTSAIQIQMVAQTEIESQVRLAILIFQEFRIRK